MPGMVLPAGSYKFELADPDSTRRVVRISEKEGGKIQRHLPQHSRSETGAIRQADRDVQRDTRRRAGSRQGVVLSG